MAKKKKKDDVNLSRRNFLKTAAATGAIATTGAISPIATAKAASETKTAKKSWRDKPDPIPENLITDAGKFDVVVVGAGTAGLLCARVASMNGASVAVIENQTEEKYTHIGGEVVCHQDSAYIYTEPQSCVGFWFALEDATVENSCMYFIPGGHKMPLKKRNHRDANGKLFDEVFDESPFPEHLKVPAEAPAGTLVVFDGRTPHMSGPNRSDRSRHAYTLHAIDRACRYPASNWLQRGDDVPLRGFKGT